MREGRNNIVLKNTTLKTNDHKAVVAHRATFKKVQYSGFIKAVLISVHHQGNQQQ